MEIWKDIHGYKGGYQISNKGRVRSCNNGVHNLNSRKYTIMKGGITKGYAHVTLCNKKTQKTLRVHTLVGIHFIPNPDNKPCINHKDGIKLNNHVSNLEWCTVAENNAHASKMGLRKAPHTGKFGENHPTSKTVLDLQTGIYYGSKIEAAIAKGINSKSLGFMLNNKYKNKTSLIYV